MELIHILFKVYLFTYTPKESLNITLNIIKF